MPGTVVTTRLTKLVQPALQDSGFRREGRIFIRPTDTGNLNGFIEFVPYSKSDPGIARFRVEWGLTLPGLVARYPRPRLGQVHAAVGHALVPPRKHYAGGFRGERQVDSVWGVSETSKEDLDECAAAVLKGLRTDVVPTIIALSDPDALLAELSLENGNRRVSHGWQRADAILLLIEDGPVEQVRALLLEDLKDGYVPSEQFAAWVEQRLQQREAETPG